MRLTSVPSFSLRVGLKSSTRAPRAGVRCDGMGPVGAVRGPDGPGIGMALAAGCFGDGEACSGVEGERLNRYTAIRITISPPRVARCLGWAPNLEGTAFIALACRPRV